MQKENQFPIGLTPNFKDDTRKQKIIYVIYLIIIGFLATGFTNPGVGAYEATIIEGTCTIWSAGKMFEVGCTCEIRQYETGEAVIYTDELGNTLEEVLIFEAKQ
ncbi:MAG: hypothetical protein AAGH79_11820 [Bacteroidota bacterium]